MLLSIEYSAWSSEDHLGGQVDGACWTLTLLGFCIHFAVGRRR